MFKTALLQILEIDGVVHMPVRIHIGGAYG
jgi:hypothetical protein